MTSNNETALAIRPQQEEQLSRYAFEPHNLDEAMKLAEVMYKSGLVPENIKSVQAAFVVIGTGRDLGFGALASFRFIHVIKNKPALSAQGKLAKVAQASNGGVCEYMSLLESSNERATWETKRRGDKVPTKVTYSLQEAKAAGLMTNAGWKANPSQMLRLRAGAMLCDLKYSDLLGGLPTTEDMREGAIDVTPSEPEFQPPVKAHATASVISLHKPSTEKAPEQPTTVAEIAKAAEEEPPTPSMPGDPPGMDPVTGEVSPEQEEKPYAALSQDERVAYWRKSMSGAPKEAVKVILATLADLEPEGSPVRTEIKAWLQSAKAGA